MVQMVEDCLQYHRTNEIQFLGRLLVSLNGIHLVLLYALRFDRDKRQETRDFTIDAVDAFKST